MFGQSPATPPVRGRHALNMPAGSVRAVLAFGILGLSWLLVWRYGYGPEHQLPLEFIYLEYLGVLILAHFFAAHGNSIGQNVSTHSPLWLPRGSVRFLLMAGYLGLAAFLYLNQQLTFAEPASGQRVVLVLLLLTSFFVGYLITMVVRTLSGGTLPYWFQDFEAWVALLALLALGLLACVQIFINPTLESQNRLGGPILEAIPVALVGFYFGARS
jgi:hypothetical protein